MVEIYKILNCIKIKYGKVIRMKIGLITITNGQNYGNRLQNYAAQQVLQSLGCEVETIKNTTGQAIKEENKYKDLAKKIVSNIYLEMPIKNKFKMNKIARYSRFNDFTKNLILQSRYVIDKELIPEELNNSYDYFVCGSDQIWNPNFFFNSEIDFLTFVEREKRIAYSPSFGVSKIPKEREEEYVKWINGMNSLSVRENEGAHIIKELTGRTADVLVDPTMMLSKEEWMKIAKFPKWKSKKKYILTYFLGNKEAETIERIKKIANENNLEIINLMDINDKNIYSVDPSEFIALINEAELMCTDSFHGVVFSLIMKTNFILFTRIDKEVSMNSRLETLLSRFDMQSRLDKNIINEDEIFNIDFSNVDRIINVEQEKTINYLKNALNIK